MTERPPSRYTSTEKIGNLQGANENSSRNREIKVRKNEMKLRKKDFEVPKNFFIPPWIIQNFHGGLDRFPPTSDFLHRNIDRFILYHASIYPKGIRY